MLRACVLLMCAATCLLASQQQVVAQQIDWSEDIEASLQRAAASGRLVLMEFTADWCLYCKRMEKTTFTNPAVVERVAQNFIAIRVDADKQKDLVSELGIKGLPAILIVSPQLQILDRISGYQTPAALVARLDKIPASGPPSAVSTTPRREAPRLPRLDDLQPDRTRQMPMTRPVTDPSEMEFEAISQEEAPQVGQQRRREIRTVSRPAAPSLKTPPAEPPGRESSFEDFRQMQTETSEVAERRTTDRFDVPVSRSRPTVRDTDSFEFEQDASETRSETRRTPPASGSRNEPSFGGYCLVTAVDSRELVAGNPRIATTWRGRRLCFQSLEHKQQFLEEPARYWPMLNGQCAITLLEEDDEVEGRLEWAAVFRQRVWLFASEAAMRTFLEDPAGVIEELQEEAEQRD